KLSQGTIELLAISGDPCDGDLWWKPDGSAWNGTGFKHATDNSAVAKSELTRRFVLRGTGFEKDASWPRWDIPDSTGGSNYHIIGPSGVEEPNLCMLTVALGQSAESMDLRIGVATGPWQTVARNEPNSQSADGGVAFALAYEESDEVIVSVSHPYNERDVRIVAIDKKGFEYLPSSHTGTSEGISQTTARFRKMNLSDIDNFEFRTRAYEWVTFKDVSLRPLPQSSPLTDTQQAGSSKLAFRIISQTSIRPDDLTATRVTQLRQRFSEYGPGVKAGDDDYQWFLFKGEQFPPHSIVEFYKDEVYILASNRTAKILLPDGSWGLKHAAVSEKRQQQKKVVI
ncbi:MAG: hypothetical protein MI922_05745, partial [Bacteroidales bacterium]|nr:hypothetical protein [Bacteroidales bacterium]